MKLYIAFFIALSCVCGALAEFNIGLAFSKMDADNNTFVSKEELVKFYMGFDDGDDGQINTEEFIKHSLELGMLPDAALYTFFVLDPDHDSSVDGNSLEILFSVIDANRDTDVVFTEYASVMNTVEAQVNIARKLYPGMMRMFYNADKSGNKTLDGPELWAVISPADANGDQIISEDEFITYWRNQTGDNYDRASKMFAVLDFDGVPGIGNSTELNVIFQGFDYTNDSMVSEVEYGSSMLYLFARVMSAVNVEASNISTYNITEMYKSIATGQSDEISRKDFTKAARRADYNQDGKVNVSEYVQAHMLIGFSKRAALYFFFNGDTNNDNELDNSEMRKIFHHIDRNRNNKVTMEEFKHRMNELQYQIYEAAFAQPKILAMIALADRNGDDQLDGEEMIAVVAGADTNSDGALSKDEFVKYWSEHTGLDVTISTGIFSFFDRDRNGVLEEPESVAIFNNFANSYSKDNLVSFDEFMNAMLYMYAKIMRGIDMERRTLLLGKFNLTRTFQMEDFNRDGFMSKAEFDNTTKAVDVSGDGKITVTEYIVAEMQTGLSQPGSVYLFYLGDLNNDLFITQDELDRSFNALDMDDDNKISPQEYATAWTSIQYQLEEASMAKYRLTLLFNWADKDKNGTLTKKELMSITEYADKNNDTVLDKSEYEAFWLMEGMTVEQINVMFKMSDTDKNGKYDVAEQEASFQAFDNNGDGTVSQDEYLYSMLWVYSRIFTELEKKAYFEKHGDAVVGFF